MFFVKAGIALKPQPKTEVENPQPLYLLEDALARYLDILINSEYEDHLMQDLANIQDRLISDCEKFASQNPLVALRLSEAYVLEYQHFIYNSLITMVDEEDLSRNMHIYSQFSESIKTNFGFHGKEISDIDNFAEFLKKLVQVQVQISDEQKYFLAECFVSYCKKIANDDDIVSQKWDKIKEILENFQKLGMQSLQINKYDRSINISEISDFTDITKH